EEDFETTARGGGIKKYFDDKGKAVLAALDKVSEKHQSQPATVALAWLLANPLITAPIVSATSERQLQTIFDAPNLELDSEDLEILNQASK
ncbi:MAG TPA: alcohol dehydrogenase, partial [Chryseobacterium sp.]|nr:alcohol dehydrogenase [Chryseobacterium sp.]